ncbi:hypothetical protein CHS0354_026657 [Potamilus streckersoni]|uniref:Uncharacterized protein n=1 Tax=Potamilus streckersoni TaxID=2493646 RepID=A0AAE0S7X5_9BIVA|nr:hypothetical protein CHS0354_026657 [Potamilus streckersoni]
MYPKGNARLKRAGRKWARVFRSPVSKLYEDPFNQTRRIPRICTMTEISFSNVEENGTDF